MVTAWRWAGGEISTRFWKGVPKKRISWVKIHGIILNFVEFRIAQKVESPCLCLKRRISTLKKLKIS